VKTEPPIPEETLAAIREPFAAMGAMRIEPPVLQPLGLILDLAGEAMRERLILAQANGDADSVLRPDFTIPAALIHIESKRPAGRYFYEGKAFRASPRGREVPEEFLQIGLESFGTGAAPEADAEIAALAWRAAGAGGRSDLSIEFGDAGLFAAFIDTLGLAEPLAASLSRAFSNPRRLRAMLETAGETQSAAPPVGDRLASLLGRLPEAEAAAVLQDLWTLTGTSPVGGRSAEEIVHRLAARAAAVRAPALAPEEAMLISRFLTVSDRPAAALDAVARLAGAKGQRLDAALKAWRRRLKALEDEGVDPKAARLSTAFGRDFGYYDGVFFEIRSIALGAEQPIAAGGRYDGLPAKLGASVSSGAVGCMVRPGRAWRDSET
jgi:ATP phosphoribosyltransferase regulatory subunit